MIIHCELLIKNKNKKPLRQNKNTVALCKKWFYHKGKDTILVSWSMPFPNQTPTESICHMFNSLSLNLYCAASNSAPLKWLDVTSILSFNFN